MILESICSFLITSVVISNFVWSFNITARLDDEGQKILPSLDPIDWGAFLAS
jgi:hypothetical protein